MLGLIVKGQALRQGLSQRVHLVVEVGMNGVGNSLGDVVIYDSQSAASAYLRLRNCYLRYDRPIWLWCQARDQTESQCGFRFTSSALRYLHDDATRQRPRLAHSVSQGTGIVNGSAGNERVTTRGDVNRIALPTGLIQPATASVTPCTKSVLALRDVGVNLLLNGIQIEMKRYLHDRDINDWDSSGRGCVRGSLRTDSATADKSHHDG
jgi:hypothetical protein